MRKPSASTRKVSPRRARSAIRKVVGAGRKRRADRTKGRRPRARGGGGWTSGSRVKSDTRSVSPNRGELVERHAHVGALGAVLGIDPIARADERALELVAFFVDEQLDRLV